MAASAMYLAVSFPNAPLRDNSSSTTLTDVYKIGYYSDDNNDFSILWVTSSVVQDFVNPNWLCKNLSENNRL